MPHITNDDWTSRIERVFLHLRKFPDGLKTMEIEEALQLGERNIRNYLYELENTGRVYSEGERPKIWFVTSTRELTTRPLITDAEEAMSLYLALRLFIKSSDKRLIAAEKLLEKIGDILSKDLDLGSDIAEAAQELTQRPMDKDYADVFRIIMRAYLHRRRVKITYHPYKGDPFDTVIEPYLLEPSAIGFSTYVISHSSIVGKLRTYKIERILSARLLSGEGYFIPPDFRGVSLLQNAWSIFYGNEGQEKITVILRFHPEVARRVRETNWHPSQSPVIDDPEKDGYVQLQFEVADTTDLKPWIRTWGANCEVLAPESLRGELIGEAKKFAELYGWSTHRGNVVLDDDDSLGLNMTLNDFFGD